MINEKTLFVLGIIALILAAMGIGIVDFIKSIPICGGIGAFIFGIFMVIGIFAIINFFKK